MIQVTSDQVLQFWFSEENIPNHFKKSPAFDKQIEDRFLSIYQQAALGHLDNWEETARGALALILVLDQFPRNLFRNDPKAFATDGKAREVTYRAIEQGFDHELSDHERVFLYMPLMHSEILKEQEDGVRLYQELGRQVNIDYAIAHRDIIAKYGRFPHRNIVLGRPSTPEEKAFLKQPGSGF